MLTRVTRLLVVALVAATTGGCWSSGEDDAPARAQATALESEDPSSPADASATASPSPSPSPSSPSPSPAVSPTPSESPPSAPSESPSSDEQPAQEPPSEDEQQPEPPDEADVPITEDGAVAAVSRWRAGSEECIDDELVDGLHRVVSEIGDSYLVHAICFLGAYQTSGRMLLYDGELRGLPVEQWVDGSVAEQPEVVGDVLSVGGGLLENVQLYRGIGDCGVAQLWEPSAAGLELVEAREQECDVTDDPLLPPDWPVVYRR